MSEQADIELVVLKWLVNRTGAIIATLGVSIGTAAMTLLAPHLHKVWLVGGILLFALTTVIALWNGVRATRNLRAKISKLEGEIHSLRVRPSPALNEISACDKVLLAVHRNGSDYERFAEITELSQIRVDDCISRLKDDGLIEFHLAAPWEHDSYFAITDSGRSYLLENHLVE